MEFQDKNIMCADCAQEFVHSAADQTRYASLGLTNEPKRCPACRSKRRSKQEAGAGNGNGNSAAAPREARSPQSAGPRGGRPGRFFSAKPDRPKREFFPAVCTTCGKETTVPFKPLEGRPVFCRDCFQSSKPARPGR